MIAKEILEIILNPWCLNQDTIKIANVFASTASKIKQSIEKELRKKEPNKYMPAYCISTKEVIKYFDLDIEFLKPVVYFNKEIRRLTIDYLNKCLLLGRYRSITIIDNNVSYLIIVINDENRDLTIPIITSIDVANKIVAEKIP